MKLEWDEFSDQPAVIKDRALKKKIYKDNRWDIIKLLATNLLMLPISYLFYVVIKPKKISRDTETFFGMSVNLDKDKGETKAFIKDLGVNNLLIRIPLHDIEKLQDYVSFAESFINESKGEDNTDRNILINILQDRRHVVDHDLLKQSLDSIFQAFSHVSNRFQIGNAINRKKWAIFSMDEFLQFYKVAYDLKQDKYPHLIFLGPSVIDFEYYFTARTLFNFAKVKYDQASSLMYVDRRGAPENTQMGLDLQNKLHLLQAMLRLSPKSSNEVVITETNWPITQTHPYAPTSEEDCVSLDDHADFLVRYYLLALASGVVKNVYWHQLIAPGYGLIDNRHGSLVKYPAYNTFKVMLSFLQGMPFIELSTANTQYSATFKKGTNKVTVMWDLEESTLIIDKQKVYSRDGEEILVDEISIKGSPVYFVEKSG